MFHSLWLHFGHTLLLVCQTNSNNKISLVVKWAQSTNLPIHQGMSAGIPAQLGTHEARKDHAVPSCPQSKNKQKYPASIFPFLHRNSSFFMVVFRRLSPTCCLRSFGQRKARRSVPYVLYNDTSIKLAPTARYCVSRRISK